MIIQNNSPENFDDQSWSEIFEGPQITSECETGSNEVLMVSKSEFEINHFLNEFPIRILNSHVFPFFYAEDVAKVLGIKRVRNSILSFDKTEIVSQELRRKYNIITYHIHRDRARRNDKIILLTEFGVYRLLMNTKSERSAEFKQFVYNVLHQLRTSGEYKVTKELEELRIVDEKRQAELGTLKSEIDYLKVRQDQYQNLLDKLTMIKIPRDPYEIVQSNIPKSLIKSSAEPIKSKHNKINDPRSLVRELSNELNIPHGMIESDFNTSMDDLRVIAAENIKIAHQFIDKYAVKFTYHITTTVTPELLTSGTVAYSVYVRDANQSLDILKKRLDEYRPIQITSKAAVYTCDPNKIIAAMNAVRG